MRRNRQDLLFRKTVQNNLRSNRMNKSDKRIFAKAFILSGIALAGCAAKKKAKQEKTETRELQKPKENTNKAQLSGSEVAVYVIIAYSIGLTLAIGEKALKYVADRYL